MQIITTIEQMQAIALDYAREKSLGFVPTMGFLHKGHLSLVEQSNKQCDLTVVSIYVNPSQFGANEDLGNYPRDLKRDLELLGQFKVDYVFCPTTEDMYPADYKTWINVEELSSVLCGASRPGHFKGVATIVLKLINIVHPNYMFMGEKDFQQIAVLRTMLKDLNLQTQIVPCPIVREPEGLALSSRNSYLNPAERKQALCLSLAINLARKLFAQGELKPSELRTQTSKLINEMGGKVDYISFVNPETLLEVDTISSDTRIVLAVYIGKTRLIDNASMSE